MGPAARERNRARHSKAPKTRSDPSGLPDSQFLGFVANGRLKIVPAAGGAVRMLATVRNNYAAGAAWGDDVIVFANWRGGLDAVRPSGAPVKAITSLDSAGQDTSHQWPSFLTDNHHFVFVVDSSKPERAGIYVGSIDGDAPRRILDASHAVAVFAPPDHLLFVRNNTLMAQSFDSVRAQLQGEPSTLADSVTPPDIRNSAIVSASMGGLVAFGGGTTQRRLAWFDRRGTRLATIDAPGTLTNPTFSPDEKQLLAVSFDPELRGVWLLDLERGAPNRLVPDGTMPMPSPAGDTIAFGSARNAGVFDMYLRRLDGPAGDESLLQTNESKFINDWSPDGRFIIFDSSNAKTGEDLWILPTFGDRRPVPYLQTEYNEVQSRISPNGRWVAYSSDESGIFDVYLQSFPTPGAKQIVSIRGGAEPVWRKDGRELYYMAADRTLMAVDVEDSGSTLRVARPRALFRAPVSGPLNVYRSHYAATADGQRFVLDAVDAPSARESISVMANWTGLLQR
jgi:Tol biopolymer transport system component